MNIAIIRFLGTNCEWDVFNAYETLGAKPYFVWFKETQLPQKTDIVILPGGFSYGDYLRCGAIARFAPIMSSVINFANKGGRVLGICNGFQILLESGLLQGALMRNHSGLFVSKMSKLSIHSNNNIFLRGIDKDYLLHIPIAHAEGCYFHKNTQLLEDNEQILLCYAGENPNGSLNGIAAICNENKNVFGLMPHPERAMDTLCGSNDGVLLLRNLLC